MPPRSPPKSGITTLPVHTRHVLGARGCRSVSLTVFCPEQGASVALEECARCAKLARIDSGTSPPLVFCVPLPSDDEPTSVGALMRDEVLCVRRDVDRTEIASGATSASVIPIVDDEGRYVGVFLRDRGGGRTFERDEAFARLRGYTSAEDEVEHVAAVNERDDVHEAAAVMTSERARCVAVVDAHGVVVGLLDDLALLAAVARDGARR